MTINVSGVTASNNGTAADPGYGALYAYRGSRPAVPRLPNLGAGIDAGGGASDFFKFMETVSTFSAAAVARSWPNGFSTITRLQHGQSGLDSSGQGSLTSFAAPSWATTVV